jgi:uncharacterized membrane protein YgdD (TMEM256/DUF423 family)
MPGHRLVAWILAFAGFLFTLALAALVIGIHDAALSRASLNVAVVSALLILAGVVLFVGGFQLVELSRRRTWPHGVRPPCKPPVIIGFLVTILLGIYLLLATAKTATTQRPMVAVVALVFIATSLVALHRFGRGARVTLARVGTIALGLIGSTLAAWEFWYQTQYIPFHAGSDVTLTADLTLLAQQKAFDVVRATVTYEDVGGAGVTVLGSTYTLTGSLVVQCHRPSTAAIVQTVFNGFLPDPQRSRYMSDVIERQPADVLVAGKFVRDGKRLDASVPASRTFIFYVPRGRYQLLRFRSQLYAIPATLPLSQRNPPTFENLPGDHQLYGFWHVDDNSWLHDLVSGRERWVVLQYQLVNSARKTGIQTSPDLRVTARFPTPTWTKQKPSAAEVEKLFAQNAEGDASEPFGDSELPLQPVAKPTAGEKLPRTCTAGQ